MDQYFKNIQNKWDSIDSSDPKQVSEYLAEIVQSPEFQSFHKAFHQASSLSEPPVDDHGPKEDVAGYVLQAIEVHVDAIAHEVLSSIVLQFSLNANYDEIQPIIDLQFDTGSYRIDIGMLWDSPLELERDRRQNCQTWAESEWPCFVDSATPKSIRALADYVQAKVAEAYPTVSVEYKFL